jgi:hypothetical protein
LVLAIGYAGWAIVPRSSAEEAARLYEDASRPAAAVPRLLPVFVMRANHTVIRHGTAVLEADGRFSVRIFSSAVASQPEATDALLFDPNFSVLWAAASDESRSELKERLNTVQDEGARAIESIITSDVFTRSYRPVLRAILTDAVSQAWEDPKTQAAFQDVLVSSDAAFKERLRAGVEAIVIARVNDAVWDMMQSNWLNALGVPLGYSLDYTPILRAVQATFLDPRLQQVFMQFGNERLSTDEARRLAERIVIGVVDALMRDRRVPNIVSEMIWDPRLRELVAPFTDAAVALGTALPRDLGGLGAATSLNPLAAHVFKSILLGQHTPLILFVTPAERQKIERLEPDAARLLRPVEMAGAT